MNGFLLDTNIVSMLSPTTSPIDGPFDAWLESADDAGLLYLSVVTIHEVEKGITLLDHKGATAKATALRGWLAGLQAGFASRILPLDTRVASIAGRLEAKALADGHNPGMADAIIAGLAKAHDLVVVTRNKKHFVTFGIAAETPHDLRGPAANP